jgi:asparagine synthase (glutamine-hydrolysing)
VERLVAVWGNADFSDARLASLARERGAACALAQGYRYKGTAVLQDLRGDFAIAILERQGRAVLAVDRTGTRVLNYTFKNDRIAFASTLDVLSAMPGANGAPSHQSIYSYLYFHVVPGPHTIYEGCQRLLPGFVVSWERGALNEARYWQMEFTEDNSKPLEHLKADFRALMRQSVADAARVGKRVGAFLSGGTDSSTVAGMLREVTGEPPRTYSIGFDAAGFDEMEHARIAARHFATAHHEYYITPQDVVRAIPLVATAHDQPFGNSSSVPTYYCAKLARDDGVDTMLGGDGGDELFGGNDRYAKQYLYSLYSDLPHTLRKALLEPLAFCLPENVPLVGKAQRYIRNACQPMPARYDNHNLVERLGASSMLTAEFLESIDRALPAREMANVYWSQRANSMINRMLGFDLKYTLADNDLPKVVRSCELAGVQARFPMLNDPLIAFAAALPSRLKVKGTRLRYFFKEALRGFLPDEIIKKTKHGFGLPFGPWLQTHEALRQIAFDSVSDLKQRGIVKRAFIDELCSRHVAAHASYYGTMIWVLMMLEQWFKRRSALCAVRAEPVLPAERAA